MPRVLCVCVAAAAAIVLAGCVQGQDVPEEVIKKTAAGYWRKTKEGEYKFSQSLDFGKIGTNVKYDAPYVKVTTLNDGGGALVSYAVRIDQYKDTYMWIDPGASLYSGLCYGLEEPRSDRGSWKKNILTGATYYGDYGVEAQDSNFDLNVVAHINEDAILDAGKCDANTQASCVVDDDNANDYVSSVNAECVVVVEVTYKPMTQEARDRLERIAGFDESTTTTTTVPTTTTTKPETIIVDFTDHRNWGNVALITLVGYFTITIFVSGLRKLIKIIFYRNGPPDVESTMYRLVDYNWG